MPIIWRCRSPSLVAFAASRGAPRQVVLAGFAVLLLAALANAWLGGYHAGVEWKFWQGPTDCSGPVVDLGSAGTLLQRLDTVKVIRCDEVQWRFLGLSLAGYNVLISLLMAADGRVGHRVGEAGCVELSFTTLRAAQSSTSSCGRPNRCTIPGVVIETNTKRDR